MNVVELRRVVLRLTRELRKMSQTVATLMRESTIKASGRQPKKAGASPVPRPTYADVAAKSEKKKKKVRSKVTADKGEPKQPRRAGPRPSSSSSSPSWWNKRLWKRTEHRFQIHLKGQTSKYRLLGWLEQSGKVFLRLTCKVSVPLSRVKSARLAGVVLTSHTSLKKILNGSSEFKPKETKARQRLRERKPKRRSLPPEAEMPVVDRRKAERSGQAPREYTGILRCIACNTCYYCDNAYGAGKDSPAILVAHPNFVGAKECCTSNNIRYLGSAKITSLGSSYKLGSGCGVTECPAVILGV